MFEYNEKNKKLLPSFFKSFEIETDSFYQRYANLCREDGSKKVVIIKNVFDNSTFRYRGFNMAEAMKDSKKYVVTYFNEKELPRIYTKLQNVSLIILQRASWSIEIQNLITFAKANKIKLIFDIDDLIYKNDYVIPYISHVSENENKHFENDIFLHSTLIDSVAKQCDEFIATNDYLAKNVSKDYNKPCRIIKNFFNSIQKENSDKALELRSKKKGFCAGYFSGSYSHSKDFEIAERALANLMAKYENFYVVVVGFMDFVPEFQKFIDNGRVKILDFVSYEFLPYLNALVDVNLIPLTNEEFNVCKSELKYFESALLKIPSVISNLESYKNIIKDGVNGVLSNDDQWYEKLEDLYLNPDKVEKMGLKAYEDCTISYTPENVRKDIEQVYDNMLNGK